MPPLPCREKEFDKVVQFLKDRWDGKHNDSLFIFGSTGVGKTSTLQEITSKDIAEKYSHRIKFFYINCANLNATGLRENVVDILTPKSHDGEVHRLRANDKWLTGRCVPTARKRKVDASDIAELVEEKWCHNTKPSLSHRYLRVITLDEVDSSSSSETTATVVKSILNAAKRATYCAIVLVLVSNGRKRVVQSDLLVDLPFESYNKDQAKIVAENIAKKAKPNRSATASPVKVKNVDASPKTDTSAPELAPHVASMLAKRNESGDARKVRDLVAAAQRLARKRARENDGDGSVTVGDVAAADKDANKVSTIRDMLSSDLLWVLCLCVANAPTVGSGTHRTLSVRKTYDAYTQLMRRLNLGSKHLGGFKEMLASLADYGLVTPCSGDVFSLTMHEGELRQALENKDGTMFTIAKSIFAPDARK